MKFTFILKIMIFWDFMKFKKVTGVHDFDPGTLSKPYVFHCIQPRAKIMNFHVFKKVGILLKTRNM